MYDTWRGLCGKEEEKDEGEEEEGGGDDATGVSARPCTPAEACVF